LKYKAVLFDLLTGLLDSWSVWNRVAGGEVAGRRWRAAYLELTYGCGAYRPYEVLVAEAARAISLPETVAASLRDEWDSIAPWDEAPGILRELKKTHRLGVVTNCSERLGRAAASGLGVPFDVIVTSERAGFYKPDPAPYRLALSELNLKPSEVCSSPARDSISSARPALGWIPTGITGSDYSGRRGLRRRCMSRARSLL